VLAAVLFVARVEFDVTVPGPLVLEESQTEIAAERHLVAVRLSVSKKWTNQIHQLSLQFLFWLKSEGKMNILIYLFVFLEEG
jgi:hypothetical protein